MNGENDGEVGIRAKFGRHTNEMIKEYFEYSLGQKKYGDKRTSVIFTQQEKRSDKRLFYIFTRLEKMKEKIDSKTISLNICLTIKNEIIEKRIFSNLFGIIASINGQI